MSRSANIIGVGMTSFTTPSARQTYTEIGPRAGREALTDAGIEYSDIEQAYVGYVYGDSTSGQTAAYQIGLTGIPVINVNNNCSTGSTALYLARQAVATGAADCVLALGFEQMTPGAIDMVFQDRPHPMARFLDTCEAIEGMDDAPMAARLFGGAGREHMTKYGTKPSTFAKIAEKARRHAANNPNAVFRNALSVDEILASPTIYEPLTRLQCCPPSTGAAAVIVCSDDFAKKQGITDRIQIAAQSMTTDTDATFNTGSMMNLVGYDMTVRAANSVYEEAGIGPDDIDVVELHDCFTTNELITYEGLALTPSGSAEKFIEEGDNTYGGKYVTNPSGGLLSKGHPLGATGLAQCYELVHHLRGAAGDRQVKGARIGLQHNLGLGGACVVGLYIRV